MITLWIVEEYGYRDWIAVLNETECADLLKRWSTIRGLTCLVPVTLIVPQAVEVEEGHPYYPLNVWEAQRKNWLRAHIHEHDDSHMPGNEHEIPEDEHFWMDGRRYEKNEYWPPPQKENA